jgi:hypothetical protein
VDALDAAAFRAVVPDNPALVRHRGALVAVANDAIHDGAAG